MFDGYVLSVCMRNVQEYVQRSVWVCLGERKSMCGVAALWTGRWLRTAAAVECVQGGSGVCHVAHQGVVPK